MTNQELLAIVDHTMLGATTTKEAIHRLCKEALEHRTAGVCIPPCYVSEVRREYSSLNICTVVGFPLGYSTTKIKVMEAECAVLEGANEIDMVVNLCMVQNGEFDKITEEIAAVKASMGNALLKVIVETCYLDSEQKAALCHCVTQGGADYIKTSTGFGSGGACVSDIRLFKEHIGEGVKIKASGGIRTREDMEKFAELGCSRIGASSAVAALAADRDTSK